MDSKVADFFKEIDALTVPEELIEDAYKNSAVPPETVKYSVTKDIGKESQPVVSKLGKTDIFCPWQEIQDDSSGYSYYWNVNTNEVTWDCPPEYAAHLQSACPSEPIANNKSKKEKKKESPAIPVGAIIPISYYGNSSSSEEFSDAEKEPSKKEKLLKVSSTKKTKTTKKPSKSKSDAKSSCDVFGPQLPPDFQFPITIPLSPTHDSSETPKVTEDVKDSMVPKSSTSPEPSEQPLVESPEHKTEYSSLDKKTDEFDKESGKKSPVSELRKEVDEKISNQTTNSVFGLRPVVDYDSFTDEDDEVDIQQSVTSPPKDIVPDEIQLESTTQETEKEEVVESSCPLFPIIPEEKPELLCVSTKRKVPETKELKDESAKMLRKNDVNIDKMFAAHTTYSKHGFGPIIPEEKPEPLCVSTKRKVLETKELKDESAKKLRKNDVNIDKMFAAHTTYSKHGFGWQNQPDPDFSTESEPICKTQKGQLDKAPINFIKSNDLLDLNLLNEDSNAAQSSDSDQEVEEKMPISPVDEKPTTELPEESVVSPLLKLSSETNTKDVDFSQAVVLKGEHGDIIINKKKKENSSNEKVAQAVELASLDIEEDIDEIDRALCAALEAKQAEKSSIKASLEATTEDLKNDCEPLCVKMSASSPESDNDMELANEKERETLIELSTDVIDKLTFLLPPHGTTLASSHSAFIVQLQTRLIDWQAKALDTKYFTARLGEAQKYLQSYEESIVSGNWMSQWDRVNKRYFYVNKVTQVTQWTYPEESSHSEAESPPNSPLHDYFQSSVTASENSHFASISTGRFVSSPPPPPPGVDSPPPLPPPSPDRLPPPPPDTTRRDPEDMDLENSNDFMPIISRKNLGYEDDRGVLPQMQDSPTLSPNINSSMTSTFMTGFGDLNVSIKLSQSSSTDGSDPTWSQSSAVQQNGSKSSLEAGQSAEKDVSSHSNTSQTDMSRTKTNKPTMQSAKKEKKKKKLQLGIGLKKKNMPSLVEKWIKIKEEQEKEDNDSEVLKSESTL